MTAQPKGQRPQPTSDARNSLSVRLGGWFEAHATGWGVAAVCLVLAAVLLGGPFVKKTIDEYERRSLTATSIAKP